LHAMGGRGKPKHSQKNTGKDVRSSKSKKPKYRPQDPERLKSLTTVRAVHNAEPKFDEDAEDIPMMVGDPSLPIDDDDEPAQKWAAAAVAASAAALAAKRLSEAAGADGADGSVKVRREVGTSAKQAKIMEKKRKAAAGIVPPPRPPKRLRGQQAGGAADSGGEEGSGEEGAGDETGARARGGRGRGAGPEAPAVAAPILKLPRMKPGETPRAYARRVDDATQEHLKQARQKVSTVNQLERRRKNRLTKRAKVAEKRAQASKAAGYGQSDKAQFGDSVLRPPILSDAAMKSRRKLKDIAARAGVMGGAMPGVAAQKSGKQSERSAEFSDYASRVREAYAKIKEKRITGAD